MEASTIIQTINASGSLATVLTVLFAAIAVRQAGQARNISSMVDIATQLNQERARAFEAGVYDMTPITFHVYQMTNLVEHASFLVNKGLVSSHAKKFLLEWLESEIKQMDSQESYRKEFASVGKGELNELKNLRARFHEQQCKEQHWDKIIAGRRWSRPSGNAV